MDLSVVILNWNTRALLEGSLRALEDQTGVEFEIIVVDNASGDRSREMVRERFPNVTLLVNPANVGFGAGNNVAIGRATGRYALFLNSDTLVTEGALAAMVRFADENPDVAILGPKLLNEDGSLQFSCRRFPNLGTGFFRNTPLGRLFPGNRFNTDYLYSDWDHETARDVDWVSGAALMIRRDVLIELGGFDERFFMFCEDVDICRRAGHSDANAYDAGSSVTARRVTYYPGAVIYHLIGKSTDQAPARMTYEFHRSQYLFYAKHYRATTPALLRPLIPAGIALRAIGQIMRFRVRYYQRRLRGWKRRG